VPPRDRAFICSSSSSNHPRRRDKRCVFELTRAGLPSVRFHDLRHTCATPLLTKGVHPKIVSEMLGHSSLSITLEVYSHVIPGMQEAAAKAMEDALGK
jgi:integrase